jgi:hypothetical protein
MNNNTTNLKTVKAPQAAHCTPTAVNKPAAGCGCNELSAKHAGHAVKGVKR